MRIPDTPDAMTLTYQYKIRRGMRFLNFTARKVNFVFNYCNETSIRAVKRDAKFLSGYDLQALTAGANKTLKLNAQTIQMVCAEYATRRNQFKKLKLNWRKSSGSKRSLGWVPFKASGIKVVNDQVVFMGEKLRFFKSRELGGRILTGSFSQDAVGDWYVNFQCEVPFLGCAPKGAVGCDLGQKDLVATSDGEISENPRTYYTHQPSLAKAQRYGKTKRAKKIQRKIARIRKDNLHKISTSLTSNYAIIILGNLKLRSGKAVNDAGHGMTKTFCEYKAIRRRGTCLIVNESYTTLTCNVCLAVTGPRGLEGLAVREWTCAGCGQKHSRDINAAKNILRIGLDTPKTSSKPLAS
jgi:putative transposase